MMKLKVIEKMNLVVHEGNLYVIEAEAKCSVE
jgi:hypothetical protein